MPLPTFVIVGAQKSGTSSLAATLRQHPQVKFSRPKELHFFDRERVFAQGLDWYAHQFAPRPAHRAWGEATPAYLYVPEVRERMTRQLPQARFVVALRNPVSRAYSHFWHERKLDHETLTDFTEALDAEPARLAAGGKAPKCFSYVDRGHYIDQLLDLEQRVGRDRIHVLLLDDLIHDRAETLRALFEFVGVDPALGADIPEQVRNTHRTDVGGQKVAASYPPIDEASAARLRATFAHSNARLAQWLGRDLPW